jgi:iron complex outermembrane recepter protein
VEWQDNQSLRWLANDRVLTSQTRNQQFNLSVGGAYVQAIIEPTKWLRITPAYRIDWVGGDFRNLLNNTAAPINKYGNIDQPKLSVAILPAKGITLYGNWGRTFQIGLGSGSYLIPPRQRDLAPSINDGWEVGIKLQRGEMFEARLAYSTIQQATSKMSARRIAMVSMVRRASSLPRTLAFGGRCRGRRRSSRCPPPPRRNSQETRSTIRRAGCGQAGSTGRPFRL